MERQNNTKALVQSGLLSGVAILAILLGTYVPFVIFLTFLIVPGIIAYIYAIYEGKYGLISLAIILIISILIIGPINALTLIIILGSYGVALGYSIKSKKSVFFTITLLSITVFLSLIIDIKIIEVVTGSNIISQGIKIMTQSFDASKYIYIKMGIPKEKIDMTIAALPTPKEVMGMLPSTLIMASLIYGFTGYFIIQKVYRRFKFDIPNIKPLSEWYIPSKISFGIILIFGISFFLMLSGYQNGQNYFINANIILVFAFTVNAVAFISSYLEKRNFNKFVRFIVILLCLLPPIGNYIYFLGIFDYVMDFRNLDQSRKRPIK